MISSRRGQDVKIKRNQLWRNKQKGFVMRTERKAKHDSWTCVRVDEGGGTIKSSHHIRAHDLYAKFEFLG